MIDRLTRGTVGAGMVTSARSGRSSVQWHRLDVDKKSRAALKAQKPAVLWFTGLSASGKSTIANPVEECRKRDPKGLYERAYAGQLRNFTGVDAPYEAPLAPEIHLPTMHSPAETLAEQVVADLLRRGVVA